MGESILYYLSVVFLFVFIVTIMVPPYLIFAGYESLAADLYNLHNYDHQWIYRSQCVFEDYSIQDCIIQGEEDHAYIETLYTTNGDPRYTGVFKAYPQRQLMINKAEKVTRDGMVGYKFANDTRDYAIYIPMLLTMLVYPYVVGKNNIKVPPTIWLIIALIPLGIDGFSQLFGFWESTNLLRWITGAIAGVGAGYYIIPIINAISIVLENKLKKG